MSTTERLNVVSKELDVQSPARILDILLDNQISASRSVSGARSVIASAAKVMADVLAAGGKLVYVGAGSSGLMAMADALELPGTFGLPNDQISLILAGDVAKTKRLKIRAEDDPLGAECDVAAAGVSEGDCAICVSASGSTPYVLSALRCLRQRRVVTLGIANSGGSPLLAEADFAIFLPTLPEVVAGSTRMGAGTAQKIALNMLSTLTAVHLGHVHDGLMVNLVADNAKLKARAIRVVASVAECSEAAARRHLDAAKGHVKIAILLASGVHDRRSAAMLLADAGGRLRDVLDTMTWGEKRIVKR